VHCNEVAHQVCKSLVTPLGYLLAAEATIMLVIADVAEKEGAVLGAGWGGVKAMMNCTVSAMYYL
jgi:uncharacterized membrane protein